MSSGDATCMPIEILVARTNKSAFSPYTSSRASNPRGHDSNMYSHRTPRRVPPIYTEMIPSRATATRVPLVEPISALPTGEESDAPIRDAHEVREAERTAASRTEGASVAT